jgi:hypothetical protein
MPIFGNGDVLSWEEYAEKKSRANVAGDFPMGLGLTIYYIILK